jgi:peptidoglycan hydrolase-like protein with peptidoglycan-binding domain
MRQLLSRPARTIAGATLAAILTGIVVNALVLQKARRSAPFFATTRPSIVAAQPTTAPGPAAGQSAPPVAQPPARPVDLGAAVDSIPVPPSRSGDPIRDLLRGEAGKETSHLTVAAQNALIKLGFAIKADGVAGASTEQAIQQFERAHGLPQSNEITAKLVKQLGAAANAAAH